MSSAFESFVSRDGWALLYKFLKGFGEARRSSPDDHRRSLNFFKALVRDSDSVPYGEETYWELGPHDKIFLVMPGASGVTIRWRYRRKDIVELRYRWHDGAATVMINAGDAWTEGARQRINAALRLTNGWEIHARKEQGRVMWYVSSRYIPFPFGKAKLAEAIGKGFVHAYQGGECFEAPL